MKITFKIHLFYYLLAILCIMNGYFKDFILISLIIIIHEFGHIIMALYYDWRIEKVVILPFGGITIFNEILNKKIKEEFMIAIMGPIFQILLFIIVNKITYDYKFNFYNNLLLIFNLMPIYPLDGSKILNLGLCKILPYKISHKISIYFSYLILLIYILYIMYNPNLILFIAIIFLFFKVIVEHKKHKYIYNKFLFERYLYNLNFNKIKKINNINNFYRDNKHIVKFNNQYVSEKNILKNLFDK